METMYFHSAPSKKGRVTVAGVITEDGNLRLGAAKCSKHDTFIKKHGRNVARGRALSRHSSIGSLPLSDKMETFPIEISEEKVNLGVVLEKDLIIKENHDGTTKYYERVPCTIGLWFKLLAEECIRRILKGELNPAYPNNPPTDEERIVAERVVREKINSAGKVISRSFHTRNAKIRNVEPNIVIVNPIS